MAIKPLSLNKFDGGLNTWSSTTIKNNQFSKLVNFYYNNDWQPETRRWYKPFANSLPKHITSYFFYQNDWTLAKTAVCHAGDTFYELNNAAQTWVSKKTGLTEFETNSAKTSWRTKWNYAVYKNVIYMCDWVNYYASWNGTLYQEHTLQPKIRYISYLQDVLYGAWDDTNPTSLYYTWTLPSNGITINANVLVVWWDENWQINWISELQSNILAFKNNNIYAINIANQTALPIDSQAWWYADRTISRVWESLVYFTNRWVDTLKARAGVTGSGALSSLPISNDVKELLDQIKEFNYNSQVAFYSKKSNNYYFSYDTNGDNIPDKTIVYSALTKGWSEYILPNIYDYGFYITPYQEEKYLFASGGSMYEFESGLDDNGLDIEYELETKAYDFDTPWLYKTYDYVDITWLKNKGSEITIKIIVDWEIVSGWVITDDNITINSVMKSLGTSSIGIRPLTWWEDNTDIEMYQYSVRVPMYASGNDIAINMSSTGGVWTLQKARISVEQEPIEVFNYNNIL